MRSAALAGLLAAACAPGCNWVFGLDEPGHYPAADAPDGGVPRSVRLTWMVARSGLGGPTVELTPIGPLKPHVMIGPDPGAAVMGLPSWPPGALMDAEIDDQGGILVPEPFLGREWRVVYTLPNDPVEHEVQWPTSEGHLTVPLFGPVDRPLVPPHSGYQLEAPGNVTVTTPTFLTTGVWTQTDGAATLNVATLGMFDTTATSMSGPLAAPDIEPGSRVAMCSTVAAAGVTRTTGCTDTPLSLAANTISTAPIGLPWSTTPTTTDLSGPTSGPDSPKLRLYAALKRIGDDGLFNTLDPSDLVFEAGVIPTTDMVSFTRAPTQHVIADDVTRPVMLSLARWTSGNIAFVEPALGLPRVVYARGINGRLSHGADLVSSIQSINPLGPAAGTSGTTPVTFPAAIARDWKLGGTALDLDDTQVGLTTDVVTLSWSNDSFGNSRADDQIVTLYEVVGGALIARHTWQTFTTSLKLSRSLFAADKTYVFEIAARAGLPMAASTGDTTKVTYPFGRSAVFAGTFCLTQVAALCP